MYVRARVHAARAVQTKSGETRFGLVAGGQPLFAAKVARGSCSSDTTLRIAQTQIFKKGKLQLDYVGWYTQFLNRAGDLWEKAVDASMLLPSVMDADPNASSVMYKMCSPGMYRNIYGVMRLVGLDVHQGMTSITIA
jgi:hypothetical protein